MSSKDTFHLRFSVALVWTLLGLLPIFALPLWVVREFPEFAWRMVAEYLGMAGVLAVVTWLFSRMQIDSGGIRLYRVQSLAWNEITGVRMRRWLSLDYLRLERHQGRPWHVPLYFVGTRPILESLHQFAPPNNPVQSLPVDQHWKGSPRR
jgi:hypothetical protein